MHDTYGQGEPLRCLTVKDEATRFCLAIEVGRSFTHHHVIAVLRQLMARYGRPRYLRSDNGPEFIAHNLTTFLKDQEICSSRIDPGKPWQNGSNESFNGTFRRECLDAELFRTVTEARVVIAACRHLHNYERPHSALGYHPPATAYGSPSSRESVSRGRSGSEPEKSTPTIDCKATIADQPDSEVVVNGGCSSLNEDKIIRKT